MWGSELKLSNPNWIKDARAIADRIHEISPETVLQGCCFEAYSRDIETVKIPAYAFESLGLPVEDRYFDYEALLYPDGTYVDNGSMRAIAPTEKVPNAINLGPVIKELWGE